MKSVLMGSWKTLDETAKIAKISHGRRRKSTEKCKWFVEGPSTKLRKLRESRKIVNFAEEFNPEHKWHKKNWHLKSSEAIDDLWYLSTSLVLFPFPPS